MYPRTPRTPGRMACVLTRALAFAAMIFSLPSLSPTLAQSPPPDHGFEFRTVGAPGNRSATQEEAPLFFPPFSTPAFVVGAVDYEYRLARTEVDVTQWFEFVQAYAPFWEGSRLDPAFTSQWIVPNTLDPNQPASYRILSGAEHLPGDFSWRLAARYCNCLENNTRLDRPAFENGVYDTSTFITNPDGTINDQATHNPSARYWIPIADEWIKGMYYDPDRYGDGQEGYWLYPDGGNEPLIIGYPENGGETSAGLRFGDPGARFLDVGSYPNVQSPWGLLDASGGEDEWLGDLSPSRRDRGVKGSQQFGGPPDPVDRLDWFVGSPPYIGGSGFRLASSVPSPYTSVAFMFAVLITFNRRYRHAQQNSGVLGCGSATRSGER